MKGKGSTYIRMDTTAKSRGYTDKTKITPRIYQITPFVAFCKYHNKKRSHNNHDDHGDKNCQLVFNNRQKGRQSNGEGVRHTFSLSRIKKPKHFS